MKRKTVVSFAPSVAVGNGITNPVTEHGHVVQMRASRLRRSCDGDRRDHQIDWRILALAILIRLTFFRIHHTMRCWLSSRTTLTCRVHVVSWNMNKVTVRTTGNAKGRSNT
jgi:hypothetical protein